MKLIIIATLITVIGYSHAAFSQSSYDYSKQQKTATSQPYYFYDDFSHGNINNWNISYHASASEIIENNQLIIDNKASDGAKSTYLSFNIDPGKDFTIETEATQIFGDDYNGYGIIWGRKDDRNFYSFNINKGLKDYCVAEYVDGKLIVNKFWTKSSAINQIGANKLSIKKHNDLISFYINDYFVGEEPFTDFLGDNIGMMVNQSPITSERKVSFKYFKITGTLRQ